MCQRKGPRRQRATFLDAKKASAKDWGVCRVLSTLNTNGRPKKAPSAAAVAHLAKILEIRQRAVFEGKREEKKGAGVLGRRSRSLCARKTNCQGRTRSTRKCTSDPQDLRCRHGRPVGRAVWCGMLNRHARDGCNVTLCCERLGRSSFQRRHGQMRRLASGRRQPGNSLARCGTCFFFSSPFHLIFLARWCAGSPHLLHQYTPESRTHVARPAGVNLFVQRQPYEARSPNI